MSEIFPDFQHWKDWADIFISHGGLWVYFMVAGAMFIEYVFPIFPGDVAIFAAGFLSGAGDVSLIIVLAAAYAGSALGLTVVFLVGRRYGRRILKSGKIWFLNDKLLNRTEMWYKKYGKSILVVSKFLPGIRFALVFFAGIAEMPFKKAFILVSISCLIWNSMVILMAHYLQQNLQKVYRILSTYTNVVFIIVIVIIILWIARYYLKRRLVDEGPGSNGGNFS
ncbi:MAG TPA: DedA family protein [candidate division Zixibacteria bacterium]|nr:DedA family protein [candidate division Zixibacteria bacterium]